MGKGYRQGRLGEEIRKIISDMLLRDLKDPRLSNMISVTAVEVTNDSSYATVYLSVLGQNQDAKASAEQQSNVIEAMNKAKGFIRREISHRVKLRHVPDLIFKIDRSVEYGLHISKIIDELDKKDDAETDKSGGES